MLLVYNENKNQRILISESGFEPIDIFYKSSYGDHIREEFITTIEELKTKLSSMDNNLSIEFDIDEESSTGILVVGRYIQASPDLVQDLREKAEAIQREKNKNRLREAEEEEYKMYLELKKKYECTVQQ